MDHGWVDSKLDFLRQNLVRVDLPLNKFFFEPIGDVYKYLATGGNDDLQWVVACIAKYLSLQTAPSVKYEWGIKMELEVAGQVRFDGRAFRIRIPFAYLGKKYAVGAILAHELTHIFLAEHSLSLDNQAENEIFTDLSGVFVGLGKLMLNGIFAPDEGILKADYILGYLSPSLLLYSYEKTNSWRGVKEKMARENLLDSVP